MNDTTLVLVCKKPAWGIGKQRLAVHFGKAVTLEIARALLACAIEDARSWPGPVVLAPASRNDVDWAQELLGVIGSPGWVVPQVNGNLGQRLNALDDTLRRRKLERLVYIGSDSPGLNEQDYTLVRAHLDHSDTVLMPAEDGGVMLMANGKNCAWPDLSHLPWSSGQLGMALMGACQNAQYSVRILRKGYDIDEPDQFLRLTTLLTDEERPARRALLALARDIAARKIARHNVHD